MMSTSTAQQLALHRITELLGLTPLDVMGIRDLLALGDIDNDPDLSVVLGLLFAARNEGGLCIPLTPDPASARLPAPLITLAGQGLQRFLGKLQRGAYQALVADGTSDRAAPLVLVDHERHPLLYFQKYECYERRLMEGLRALVPQPPADPVSSARAAAIVADLFSEQRVLRVGAAKEPILADPDQTAAIGVALQHQFCIVSGGPGTGKTAVMVNLLRALTQAGVEPRAIALAAPTGRAAQHMSETLAGLLNSIRRPWPQDIALSALQAGTLHKLLGYSSGRHDFLYHADYPLPFAAVVIDEASMVDVVMMARLVEAVDRRATRLILIGDKDQLPSVEAGAIFAQLMPVRETKNPLSARQVTLQHSYRAGRRLQALAERVNRGELPPQDPVRFSAAIAPGHDCWYRVNPTRRRHWPARLEQWVTRHYLKARPGAQPYADLVAESADRSPKQLIADGDGRRLLDQIFTRSQAAKILTVVRRGPHGSEWINAFLARTLAPRLDPTGGEGSLFSGAPIICSRNDYRRGLFNGEMGVVIRHQGVNYAYFRRSQGFLYFPVIQTPFWELALAITVHKSQGSEFDEILLVLPDDPRHRLLTREIIYTGITRARRQITIYGSEETLQTALQNRLSRNPGRMGGIFSSSES